MRRRSLGRWALGLLFVGCGTAGDGPANLLTGKSPSRSSRVLGASSMTDEVAGRDGGGWNSNLTAVLWDDAVVVYDLGAEATIRSAYLQGDHNDEYEIATSSDGANWNTLWVAPKVDAGGLRGRFTGTLDGRARYVRLRPLEGDGRYGIAAFGLYAEALTEAPRMIRRDGVDGVDLFRSATVLLGLAFVVFVGAAGARLRWWWVAAFALVPAAAALSWAFALARVWPVDPKEVTLVRGMAAAVAGLALCREVILRSVWAAHRGAVVGTLAAAGAFAVFAFYNLGRPQFFDAKTGEATYVHYNDTRVYFPVAKYFKELSFDGLYLASIAAHLENEGDSLDKIRHITLRDLKTHEIKRVSEIADLLPGVKARFSLERWEEFKKDAAFFEKRMGWGAYVDAFHDHGGNATPVWMLQAHVIWGPFAASNGLLLITGLIDPLLFLILFLTIGRTFGVRTALVSMVVFGANDFYMFGTNWSGATLRHDWLVYLGLGLCMLKREKWIAAGVLLAASAMIRAFPALALVGAAFPALVWLGAEIWKRRRLPSWSVVRETQRPILRVALASTATVAFLMGLTVFLMGPSAWKAWIFKVQLLDAEPHMNAQSLRTLVGGWDWNQPLILGVRWPLFAVLMAAFVGAVIVTARRRPLHEAATLGIILVPIVFSPSNYYVHLVCYLPFLARERPWREGRPDAGGPAPLPVDGSGLRIWLVTCAMCFGAFWATLVPDQGLRFFQGTAILLSSLAAILVILLREDFGQKTGAAGAAVA